MSAREALSGQVAPFQYEFTLSYNTVYFVDSPCGSGKTHSTTRLIIETIRRLGPDAPNFLLVVPTHKLAAEISETLRAEGVGEVMHFHPDNKPEGIVKALRQHLKTFDGNGAITICTHSAFLQLPYFPRRDRWRVFIDEIPQIDEFFQFTVSLSRDFFRSWFRPLPYNDGLCIIAPRSTRDLRKILESGDSMFEPFHKLIRHVISDQHVVYANAEHYSDVIMSDEVERNAVLSFLSVIRASIFEGTTILAADLRGSILQAYLKQSGMTLVDREDISRSLRYRKYPSEIGARCRIRYLLETGNYSKYLSRKRTTDGRTVIMALHEAIEAHIGDRRALLLVNNGDRGLLTTKSNLERLPGVVSGLNEYDDHDCLVFVTAQNRPSEQQDMLVSLGISKNTIRDSTVVNLLHQAAMRTNLRVDGSNRPVEIIVSDKSLARSLSLIIGCADIQRIQDVERAKDAEKPEPLSKTQMNRRSDYRALIRRLFDVGQQQYGNWEETSALKKKPPEKRTHCSHHNEPQLMLTFHKRRHDNTREQHPVRSFTPENLLRAFRWLSKVVRAEKEDRPLFNTTVFQPRDTDAGYRRKEYFDRSYGLVLDFDNGALSPQAFVDIFWKNAGPTLKRSFIITNSFSRSPDKPNKFHVILPFKKAATLDQVHAVYDSISTRLAENGYPEGESGLDKASRTGVQSFYVPCTNRAHPESAFFQAFGMKGNEFETYAIDPENYRAVGKSKPGFKSSPNRKAPDSADLDWAEQEKTKLRAMSEDRHRPLFDFAIGLRSRGFDLAGIGQQLLEVAGNDPKLRPKVDAVMASLKTYQKGP